MLSRKRRASVAPGEEMKEMPVLGRAVEGLAIGVVFFAEAEQSQRGEQGFRRGARVEGHGGRAGPVVSITEELAGEQGAGLQRCQEGGKDPVELVGPDEGQGILGVEQVIFRRRKGKVLEAGDGVGEAVGRERIGDLLRDRFAIERGDMGEAGTEQMDRVVEGAGADIERGAAT